MRFGLNCIQKHEREQRKEEKTDCWGIVFPDQFTYYQIQKNRRAFFSFFGVFCNLVHPIFQYINPAILKRKTTTSVVAKPLVPIKEHQSVWPIEIIWAILKEVLDRVESNDMESL